jgi:hypothetical protein
MSKEHVDKKYNCITSSNRLHGQEGISSRCRCACTEYGATRQEFPAYVRIRYV